MHLNPWPGLGTDLFRYKEIKEDIMNVITTELAIGGAYFPPVLVTEFLSLPAAMLTAMLLNRCRLARFFYHAPLILVVTCVLSLGLGEPVWAITMHKGQTGHMDTTANR